MADTKTVCISKSLFEQAQAAAKSAGFATVDEYVAFVLDQVLQSTGKDPAASSEQDDKVRKRLKALGYME